MPQPDLVTLYLFIVLGIVISVLLPILRQALPRASSGPAGMSGLMPRMWAVAKPYLALGLFSCLAGVLVLAAMADEIADWRAALLAGYAVDSTLQKLKAP